MVVVSVGVFVGFRLVGVEGIGYGGFGRDDEKSCVRLRGGATNPERESQRICTRVVLGHLPRHPRTRPATDDWE